jgi:HSP20 family protein
MNENTELVARTGQGGEITNQLPLTMPAIDVFENDSEILLHADMPGVVKEDISVNIDNGKMTLSGIRRLHTTGAANWREFRDTEFRRIFSVPQSIDIDKVHAELKEGVLRLHLPKSDAAKLRQIEIISG